MPKMEVEEERPFHPSKNCNHVLDIMYWIYPTFNNSDGCVGRREAKKVDAEKQKTPVGKF